MYVWNNLQNVIFIKVIIPLVIVYVWFHIWDSQNWLWMYRIDFDIFDYAQIKLIIFFRIDYT